MGRGRVLLVTLTAVLLGVAVGILVPVAGRGPQPVLVVRDSSGAVLARMTLADAAFALRYRNSLYGSLAEERFVVEGGLMLLRELAADERAVLDEYYVIAGPARPSLAGDARPWRASPADDVSLSQLAIAATDLGARTVLVSGAPPLELWRFVEDDRPTVVLTVEPTAP